MAISHQIKTLREQKHITGKDLAQRIGLSQSQMSRLEQGKRRIDTEILIRIAEALDVSPAAFFQDTPEDAPALTPRRQKDLDVSHLHRELGRLIRSERRKRHLTSDDLALKLATTKAYVRAVEEGRRNGMEGDFLRRACRFLGIDPLTIVEMQEGIIRGLKWRMHEQDLQLARQAATPGGGVEAGEGGSAPDSGTPVLLGDESLYPTDFDEHGLPMAAVESFLYLPELGGRPTFALRVQGTDMESSGGAHSFFEGDVVVFATDRAARSGEFAFVHHDVHSTTFRRLYRDDEKTVRLHALREEIPPILIEGKDVRNAWPLVAQLVLFED